MKKVVLIIGVAITLCYVSCSNVTKKNSEIEIKDSVQNDTLAAYLQKLDSVNNSGKLRHLNIYKLGKMKSIEFQVVSIESETDTVEYINLRKDCGGEYYYDWENASLLAEEVKYFVTAIDTISANFERYVENEERYVYITKDDIRLISSNDVSASAKWSANLSVDYQKKNSYINIGKDDFTTLKSLLQKGEQKIKELRNNKTK